MKTAIRIALSDPEYAGDQKSCEYDSVTGELTVNNNIEAAYPYRSGVNGYGLIYDASKTEGGIFVYRSDEKINGYSGFDIRTGAKELLGNSPDAPLYAVQYMESKPDWISDGISMAKIKEGLRGTCAWLKVSSAMPPRLKNRGVIAIIVDKLLQATEEETAAAIGLVDTEKNDLQEIRKTLYRVLKLCLPAAIANKISFNTNANENVAGMDIFCTTVDAERYESQGCTVIDVNKGLRRGKEFVKEYEFRNPYAEYVAKTTENPLSRELAGISDVGELNRAGALKLLAVECGAIKDCADNRALGRLAERLKACQDSMKDEKIRTALSKIAYKIFFSECYLSVSKENKEFFRPFLAFLKTDEGFASKINRVKITEKFKLIAGSVSGREYIDFLTESKEELPDELQAAIRAFLDSDPRYRWGRGEANEFLQKIDRHHDLYYEQMPCKKPKEWIRTCQKDRTKRSDSEPTDAYSPKANVAVGEALMTAAALIVAFCFIHFIVYPVYIGEWLPYHPLNQNRFMIEGILAAVLLAVGIGKIIYDTVNYREKTPSLFVACVRSLLEGLALSLAVIALASVVCCILFFTL